MDLDLGLVFLIGLLGSAHCVGMCGGFVVALTGLSGDDQRRHARGALYALGKTLTYTAFGALAGGLGAAAGHGLAGVQNALSIAVGLALVAVGLGLTGAVRRVGGAGRLAGTDAVARMLAAVLRRRGGTAAFGLGLVNGLLPCGLIYALLFKAAATGTVAGGALTMAVFGLATLPALYAVALTGTLLRPAWRARMGIAGGVLVVALGLLTLARGVPALGLLHAGHAAPAAHTEPHEAHRALPSTR